MDKKKKLRSKKIAGIRGWIQAAATLLTNPHIPNFFQGKIYQGKAKTVCVPGLNCYSCPAATGACPIGAFQAVRQGQTSTALVPSLYALRADGRETFLRVPQEGPVLIPSYLCARASAPEWAARRVAERILSRELCDFYAANGDLIVYPACTGRRSGQEADYALCPSAAWLEHLSHVDFYRLYCTKLPSAIEFAYA